MKLIDGTVLICTYNYHAFRVGKEYVVRDGFIISETRNEYIAELRGEEGCIIGSRSRFIVKESFIQI